MNTKSRALNYFEKLRKNGTLSFSTYKMYQQKKSGTFNTNVLYKINIRNIFFKIKPFPFHARPQKNLQLLRTALLPHNNREETPLQKAREGTVLETTYRSRSKNLS